MDHTLDGRLHTRPSDVEVEGVEGRAKQRFGEAKERLLAYYV